VSGRVHDFFENFGKVPEVLPPPMIPQHWRMPVFLTMIAVGLIALALVLALIVIPAMRSQPPVSRPAPTAGAASRTTQ